MRTCLPPVLVATLAVTLFGEAASEAQTFTRLDQIAAPQIIASSESYPDGHHEAANILDGVERTEYASNGQGTNTFLEFDFGRPVRILAFKHIDRNDPATVAASKLTLLDETGTAMATLDIAHVNQRSGVTVATLPAPVTARRARWQITRLGSNLGMVGGAEIAFLTPGVTDAAPAALTIQARPEQLLEYKGAVLCQPLAITLNYPYAEPLDAVLETEGATPMPIHLNAGVQTLDLSVAAVTAENRLRIELKTSSGQTLATQTIEQKPVRKLQIFILPHSHVDIGYTALQADVEQKQNSNIETGIRLAQASGDYPPEARFKWNVEVLWPVENYLRDASPQKREEFINAVRSGQVGLDAFYGNTLTGLCRPEELLNLMSYATRLAEVCGVQIESAMISDVPGYTWSTVSAMAQAGVKYFSFAPNYSDRMGTTMQEWQNRPFWWKAADGHNRVLCWCPSRGYALGHLIGDREALARFLPHYLRELETNGYLYDITYLRWNVHGDNGSPDEKLADVVRDWNARYIYPHLIISTTAEAFREFERQYGSQLPVFSGDYTPYWEDGAASSAFETALNRASAERLVQAETLWAMRRCGPFPAEAFQEAWRNVLLYDEHTWGAHNSISQPDLPFVLEQWKVKQSFSLQADRQSQDLLKQAGAAEVPCSSAPGAAASESSPRTEADSTSSPLPLSSRGGEGSHLAPLRNSAEPGAIDIWNTSSWSRTDLVTVSAELSKQGDRVVDDRGALIPSQRLSSGELAFVAKQVPAFGSKRFWIRTGEPFSHGIAQASMPRLTSSAFFVRVSEETGGIAHLFSRLLGRELVASNSLTALNDYFYLPGSDLAGLQRNGAPRISVKENGPLVASLLIESAAPGCRSLRREVRVIDGLDRVEMINTVDKLPIRAKEGVHFGYAFDVPKGQMRMDVGWAEVRPELDQIPGACKNWFSVQRWVDISNERFGVTWSPVDAPLVEVGSITANLVGSQNDPRAWIQHLAPSQTLFSWVMNNHWHTNYRAEQNGPTVFRYTLRAHQKFAHEEAARFGIECSQPLIISRASAAPTARPRLKVEGKGILVTAFKPADDGEGWVIRLFGSSGTTQEARLTWNEAAPHELWLSDLSEKHRGKAVRPLEVPGWGIVTLRAN